MRIKFLIIVLFLISIVLPAYSAELACDLDGSGDISSSDVAIFAAWLQTRKSTDKAIVQARARAFISTVVVARLPVASDKLVDSSADLDSKDLAFLAGYLQTRKSSDFALVEARAKSILGVAISLSKLPGAPVGDSTIPLVITGIQTDSGL